MLSSPRGIEPYTNQVYSFPQSERVLQQIVSYSGRLRDTFSSSSKIGFFTIRRSVINLVRGEPVEKPCVRQISLVLAAWLQSLSGAT